MEQQAAPAFARILVPVDGSTLAEQALPYAQAIGGAEAEFTLLEVVPPAEAPPDLRGVDLLVIAYVPPHVHRADDGATVEEAQARSDRVAREHLLTAVRTWLGDRTNVSLQVAVGDPAEEILRAAEKRGADLIVLASHGRGTVGRAVFGSVADRIAHASPVPVMIVRPRDAAAEIGPVGVDRLVVPLDGSDLAARALPVAEGLARRMGLPILLLRALDLPLRSEPFAGPAGLSPMFFEEEAVEARRTLEAAAAPLRSAGALVTTEVLAGSPSATIAGAARPGDVIVLSSHGRSGVRRWLLGSVAEKLVRSGPVPVIVVPVGEQATTGAGQTATAQAT